MLEEVLNEVYSIYQIHDARKVEQKLRAFREAYRRNYLDREAPRGKGGLGKHRA